MLAPSNFRIAGGTARIESHEYSAVDSRDIDDRIWGFCAYQARFDPLISEIITPARQIYRQFVRQGDLAFHRPSAISIKESRTNTQNPESVAAYVWDYECLLEGVAHFFELEQEIVRKGSVEAIRRHYEQNPDDKLCHIYRPGTREIVSCRRSGIDAVQRMALRLVGEAANGCDLSAQRIAEIICERVLQVAIDHVTDDEEFVGILKTYVAASEAEHVEAEYHFPCVLFHCGPSHPNFPPPPPDQFVLGPVTFRRYQAFLRELNSAVQTGNMRQDERTIETFSESGEKYGWVASIRIPLCAPDVSRRRAEQIVEAAINLLKVFIGLRHGRSMRLPHTAPSRNRETCVLTEVNNSVTWTWQGRSLDGALVSGDPTTDIPVCLQGFAADLLNKSLTGSRDESTIRLLDALKWFGDASFEESGGVQIVKWIAALERLTATERIDSGITHRFCKRVALLASGLGTGQVDNAFRDAYRAYDLRSDVMHGSRSQDDEHLLINTGFVHDLTREALIGALAMHHFLGTVVGEIEAESIEQFYERSAVRHEPLFQKLKQELRDQARSKAASP